MSYTRRNYEEVNDTNGLHFMRDALKADNLGFTVLETDEGWEGKEHDHADEGHEEIYFLVEGDATLDIDGDTVWLEEGDAVRVDPGSTRQLRTPEPSTIVIAGAP
ncbi:MAG: cupin domain-containing protein [Candidatus Nanohaloarchaea archaeon]|nr:cupin domain-containing protein [Candidatus Nanohaloarchaea archaeon]